MSDVAPITPEDHAHQFATKYIGLRIQDQKDSTERTVTWPDLVGAFQAAADSAVDEYIRKLDEQAYQGNAHDGTSRPPEEAQETPHRMPVQSIIVRYMNGAEEIIHTHHPMVHDHGWTFRQVNGIPYFVVGHGTSRRQYPLCNIAFIELSPELL